jgi:hypothetical protein
MRLNHPSLRERISTMTDQQLVELADGESLAMADSSRIEGLILDQDRIRRELLDGYWVIRAKTQSKSYIQMDEKPTGLSQSPPG